MTPHYKMIEVGGKELAVFYPQYKDDDGYKIIDPENRFPIELKNHDEYMSFLETLVEREQELKDGLTTLADLIEEMDMLARGPKGDTRYMWVKYADDEQGNGMSDDPSGKKYIGFAFNKDTETPSDDPSDYKFVKYVADYEGLEIGGRNLIPNSNNFSRLIRGDSTVLVYEDNVSVPEWSVDDATYIEASTSRSDNRILTSTINGTTGLIGVWSIYIKNMGDTDIEITPNGWYTDAELPVIVSPNEFKRVVLHGIGRTNNDFIQFHFRSIGTLRAIFFGEQLEKGTVPTDWSPAPEDIYALIDDIDAEHVGLGNVQNYGIASQSQAENGTSNNAYMTPLRTKQAIDSNLIGAVFIVDSEVGEDFGCIKYSNGMMECWARVELTRQANTRMGGYWTFDYEFISPPNVTFTVDNNGTSITPSTFEVGNNYIRNITNKDVEITVGRVYGMTNYEDGDVMYVFARAIGRWR